MCSLVSSPLGSSSPGRTNTCPAAAQIPHRSHHLLLPVTSKIDFPQPPRLFCPQFPGAQGVVRKGAAGRCEATEDGFPAAAIVRCVLSFPRCGVCGDGRGSVPPPLLQFLASAGTPQSAPARAGSQILFAVHTKLPPPARPDEATSATSRPREVDSVAPRWYTKAFSQGYGFQGWLNIFLIYSVRLLYFLNRTFDPFVSPIRS